MTIWLIILSGFAYQVGADIPGYMSEYDSFSFKRIDSISDLINYKDNRQPLWVLLEYLCHGISSNFLLFKLVIAIISNWVFTRFIVKHSLYPFVSLLFYCLLLYLNLNFNALRQLLAVVFFLIGYDALVDRKWIRYFIWCFIAYLFHSSAIICLAFPLLYLIPLNTKSIIIISSSLLVGVFIILQSDVISFVYDIFLNNAELVPDDYSLLIEDHLSVAESNEASFNGMIFIMLQVLLMIFVLVANLKLFGQERSLMLKILVVYILLSILNRAVPVVFTRFMQYFDIFYCCLIPSAIIPICKRITGFKLAPVIMIIVFAYLPINTLMSENKQTGRPLIVQYYPYYSVFNPKIDSQRSMLFGAYRGDQK